MVASALGARCLLCDDPPIGFGNFGAKFPECLVCLACARMLAGLNMEDEDNHDAGIHSDSSEVVAALDSWIGSQ